MKTTLIDGIKFKLLMLTLFGCNVQTHFKIIQNPHAASTGIIFENSYDLKTWVKDFQFTNGPTNKTTVQFRVLNSLNESVSSFPNEALQITENNYPISDFQISKKSNSTMKNVDIALVFDVTGSMKNTIENAKLQITKFVTESYQKKLSIRFCLVTFGDYTIKTCNKFYNTSPDNPNSELEIKQFLSEISELHALSGPNDPGGNDYNENPLRAIIDAADSPWNLEHQHFVILVTDDGFLYSPGNSGAVGNLAPTFAEVLAKVDEKKLRIFAATYNYPGYITDFVLSGKNYPSLVKQSVGEWFNYADLVSQKISLSTIFDRIGAVVDTTFQVQYELKGDSPLPSWLPLSQRNINPKIEFDQLKITDIAVTSNLPNGGFEQSKIFKLSNKKIKKSSLKISISDSPIFVGYFVDENENLNLSSPIASDSVIKVEFNLENPFEAFEIVPINLLVKESDLNDLIVFVNDIRVDRKYYSLRLNKDSIYTTLAFYREIFGTSGDIFKIEETKKFELRVQLPVDPSMHPRAK